MYNTIHINKKGNLIMPISPNDMKKYDEKRLGNIYQLIDDKLHEEIMDSDEVSVIIYETLTDEEKKMTTTAYKHAGWADVKIVNSSEMGEHGGLCEITLYTKEQ
jgi:hypothetical protein